MTFRRQFRIVALAPSGKAGRTPLGYAQSCVELPLPPSSYLRSDSLRPMHLDKHGLLKYVVEPAGLMSFGEECPFRVFDSLR